MICSKSKRLKNSVCEEIRMKDGALIAIDIIALENQVAESILNALSLID